MTHLRARQVGVALALVPAIFVLLLVVGFLPWANVGPATAKSVYTFLLTGALALAAGSALIVGVRALAATSLLPLLAFLTLPLWAFAVSLAGGLSSAELSGLAFEPDSLASFVVFSVWGAVFFLFAGRTHSLFLSGIFAVALVILSLWQGSAGFLEFSRNAPLLGDAFSQALGIAALTLAAFSVYLFRPLPPLLRQLFAGASILAAVSFFAAPFPSIATSAAAVAGALFVLRLIRKDAPADAASAPRPRKAVVAPLLFVATLFITGFFGGDIAPSIGLTPPPGELRLSPSATVTLIAREYAKEPARAFVGAGAGEFSYVWNMYRPLGANASPLWNAEGIAGFGLFPMLAATLGAPFAFFVLLLLGYLLVLVVRSLAVFSPRALVGAPLGVGVVFALAWLVLYPPSTAYLALAAAATGAFLGVALRERAAPEGAMGVERGKKAFMAFMIVLGAVLIVFGAWSVWRASVRSFALSSYQEAITALEEGRGIEAGRDMLRTAYRIEALPLIGRTISLLNRQEIQAILERTEGAVGLEERERIRELLAEAEQEAGNAASADPGDFRNPLERAYVATIVALLTGEEAARADAVTHYDVAIHTARAHPIPYFAKAQALALFGKRDDARRVVEEALALKPDYEPALRLKELILRGLTEEGNQ